MSSRTPNQDKAIAWYCQEYNMRPQLSAHPIYYFRDKEGVESSRNIENIVADWETWRKEQKRVKKLEKRRTA